MLPLRSISSLRLFTQFPASFIRSSAVVARPITTTAVNLVKEIKIKEDGDKIVVEAVPMESERKEYLVKIPAEDLGAHQFCNACPLCRLNLRRLEYSDVLILHQFIESNGRLMPREVTSLCHRSYQKVKKLVGQAQAARLLPRSPEYESFGPWDNLNRYYEARRRQRDQPMRIIRKEYWENSIQ